MPTRYLQHSDAIIARVVRGSTFFSGRDASVPCHCIKIRAQRLCGRLSRLTNFRKLFPRRLHLMIPLCACDGCAQRSDLIRGWTVSAHSIPWINLKASLLQSVSSQRALACEVQGRLSDCERDSHDSSVGVTKKELLPQFSPDILICPILERLHEPE